MNELPMSMNGCLKLSRYWVGDRVGSFQALGYGFRIGAHASVPWDRMLAHHQCYGRCLWPIRIQEIGR